MYEPRALAGGGWVTIMMKPNLDLSNTLTYCTLQMLAGGFDYKVIATFTRVMSSKNKQIEFL